MPNTYVALRTETIATATPSVTLSLSGISGYTDLVLVIQAKTTDANTSRLNGRYNSDTGDNYSYTQLTGNGSTASSARIANFSILDFGAFPSTSNSRQAQSTLHIMNYANTNVNKTTLSRFDDAGSETTARVGLWRNTAAITSISMSFGAGNIAAGSTFSLYGIANAPALTTKATGGTIFFGADGYVYHRFTGSGSFVPSSNLSADCLVVAGGGGSGAGAIGGGGGAGGFRVLESQSLVNGTTYSVSIGGGGAAGIWGSTDSGANGVDSSISATSFTTITSSGGGGGGGGDSARSGLAGGSGGGSNYIGPSNGGAGNTPSTSPSQGNNGANSSSNGGNIGGGGGGAGAAATNQNGGAGSSAYSIWGSATSSGQYILGSYWYAGGGGGGSRNGTTGGTGGSGGGGAGSTGQGSGTAGTANTGGGGGGAGFTSNNTISGSAGGSGIVIIRYLG